MVQQYYNKEKLALICSEISQLERAAAKQYEKVLKRVEDPDLKQHLQTFRDESIQHANAVDQLITDLELPKVEKVGGFVDVVDKIVPETGRGDLVGQFQDLEDLLTIEARHRSYVEILRMIGDATDDPRIKGACEFMSEKERQHASWLAAKVDETAPIAVIEGTVTGERPEEFGDKRAA